MPPPILQDKDFGMARIKEWSVDPALDRPTSKWVSWYPVLKTCCCVGASRLQRKIDDALRACHASFTTLSSCYIFYIVYIWLCLIQVSAPVTLNKVNHHSWMIQIKPGWQFTVQLTNRAIMLEPLAVFRGSFYCHWPPLYILTATIPTVRTITGCQ